ncbi:MAG: hypothetical protein MI743_14765, partial [Sneathiellales bacterium]|nr:hypothetical protein [Sneathiellales bacterium]
RKPKTQNERKADQEVRQTAKEEDVVISGRRRTKSKEAARLPTEWSDLSPASQKDRSRGKSSHSPARKSKSKARDRLFEE